MMSDAIHLWAIQIVHYLDIYLNYLTPINKLEKKLLINKLTRLCTFEPFFFYLFDRIRFLIIVSVRLHKLSANFSLWARLLGAQK